MSEEELIKKDFQNFIQVKVECFDEITTKRCANGDGDQSNKRLKN